MLVEYDGSFAIGRLVKKKHGVEEETLAYNSRGWLTGKESVPFKMKLRHENPAGSAAAGSYVYDKNGNMINDTRRILNLSYNFLNLLNEVAGGELKARYDYLADGTKLRVRDAGGNGFDYLGSLTYKSGSAGLQLESASFGDGVI